MKKKSVILVVFILILTFFYSVPCYAHKKAAEHNKELEKVLFVDGFSKYRSNEVKQAVQALEYASYLSIDQFNGGKDNGKKEFETLKAMNMGGLPLSFSSIDYREDLSGLVNQDGTRVQISANNHRLYTHQGWEMEYPNKNVNSFMTKRRNVLMGTVNTIFDFRTVTFLVGYDEKCQSLSGIIYYVHILGDYDEADNYKKISTLVHLAGDPSKDATKDTMIPDLMKYIEILFADQEKDSEYKELMNELEKIEKNAYKIENSIGGVNTDEEFDEYQEYANEVLEALIEYMPDLLKDEDFFKNVFYK